jgi:hypothetical protein
MRHATTITASLLTLGLNLAAVSCALPLPDSQSADSNSSRPWAASGSDVELQALQLEESGNDRELVSYISNALDRRVPGARKPATRARLGLMCGRALQRLERKLTALTTFGRAWQEVFPDANGVGGEILEQWAQLEMNMGNYKSAMDHYARALRARDLSRGRERELRCCLIVACEAAGKLSKASEQIALLDHKGRAQIGATRTRLLTKHVKRQRPTAPGIVDAFLPQGVIPMNPSLILAGIRPRKDWGARAIRPDHVPMAPITSITVHHTAMPAPGRYSAISQLKQIQNIHTEDNGWADVGYHFIVDPQGQVWEGRRLMHQGAHAGGAANIGNVGVCLMGNFETDRVPRAQIAGLTNLLEALRVQFDVPRSEVRTHREWKATACPGQHLQSVVAGYRAGSSLTLALQ